MGGRDAMAGRDAMGDGSPVYCGTGVGAAVRVAEGSTTDPQGPSGGEGGRGRPKCWIQKGWDGLFSNSPHPNVHSNEAYTIQQHTRHQILSSRGPAAGDVVLAGVRVGLHGARGDGRACGRCHVRPLPRQVHPQTRGAVRPTGPRGRDWRDNPIGLIQPFQLVDSPSSPWA